MEINLVYKIKYKIESNHKKSSSQVFNRMDAPKIPENSREISYGGALFL